MNLGESRDKKKRQAEGGSREFGLFRVLLTGKGESWGNHSADEEKKREITKGQRVKEHWPA